MSKLKTYFPLYLGFTVFLIAILATSVTIGERTVSQSGILQAQQQEANLSIIFTSPDIVSINVVSSKEITGGDFELSFNSREIEVLPSTLNGVSNYLATGGVLDTERGRIDFSVVNTENPIKNGILASFKVRGVSDNKDLSKINLNFVSQESRLYDLNTQQVITNFAGINSRH